MRLVLLLFACSGDLTNAAFVDGLRLLGAQSQPPEAGPGDSVTLTAWAVDSGGQAIEVSWSACLLPPVPGSGQLNPGCITNQSGGGIVALGDGAVLDARVPAYDLSQLGPPDITGGIYLPLHIGVTTSTASLDGIYRLRAPAGQPPNHNPMLAGLFVVDDGARTPLDESTPFPAKAGQTLTLEASFTADSAESYLVSLPGAPPRAAVETLSVVWYATGGRMRDETTGPDVPQILQLDASAHGTVDVWVVGQDERGGADLLHRTLIVD